MARPLHSKVRCGLFSWPPEVLNSQGLPSSKEGPFVFQHGPTTSSRWQALMPVLEGRPTAAHVLASWSRPFGPAQLLRGTQKFRQEDPQAVRSK